MKKHTKCRMNEICRKPHRDGECERNCYYNTIEVKTNADKIRSMTDEELARWFIKIQDDVADYYDGGHAYAPELPTMENSWLEWLRQEAET